MTIRFLFTAGLLYPTALALVIALDTLVGDAEFLQHFLTVSRKQTLLIVLSDWGQAIPYCLAFAATYLLAEYQFGQRSAIIGGIAVGGIALLASVMPPHLPTIIPCALFTTVILAVLSRIPTRKYHEKA
ncbi:hypothetical protein [Simiduia agarivorans]|uniref:Uncharacterized protein n=1 Tax=Simiduia agarivorans (strain DSM 21679 / JCM 13881 / BCRC 17597 / SA1) TaxID=1117647 RepID=K4KIW7_SIMAS|nr:hypothetical protein [Simiduia agarivorans]AFU98976.1 hypothetical protein M5M_08945 [Simiduia agarivorans SA1 = DSM 21679]